MVKSDGENGDPGKTLNFRPAVWETVFIFDKSSTYLPRAAIVLRRAWRWPLRIASDALARRMLLGVNLYLTFSQYTSEQFIQHFCSRRVCGLRGAIDSAFQFDAHGLSPPSYFPSIATGKIPHAADRNEVMVIVAGVNQTIDVARHRCGRRALQTWIAVSIIPTSSRGQFSEGHLARNHSVHHHRPMPRPPAEELANRRRTVFRL